MRGHVHYRKFEKLFHSKDTKVAQTSSINYCLRYQLYKTPGMSLDKWYMCFSLMKIHLFYKNG